MQAGFTVPERSEQKEVSGAIVRTDGHPFGVGMAGRYVRHQVALSMVKNGS